MDELGNNVPVVGATVRVDALPEVFAVTDSEGFFRLENVPAPLLAVHIDGSTATNAPAGTSYATVGKIFESVPGQEVQLNHHGSVFDIFLPTIAESDIQDLSATEDTEVGFGTAGVAQLQEMFPEVEASTWELLQVTFPAGSAQDEAGKVATTATIVPVNPERLPAPLPPHLNPELVVSIQAPGATNFDVPAPITFPNMEGLAPGEQSLIWSFNHDSGEWEVVGTGTVSEDGLSIVSDPGTGILAPGWHFVISGTQSRFSIATSENPGFMAGPDYLFDDDPITNNSGEWMSPPNDPFGILSRPLEFNLLVVRRNRILNPNFALEAEFRVYFAGLTAGPLFSVGQELIDHFISGSQVEFVHDIGSPISNAVKDSGTFQGLLSNIETRIQAEIQTQANGGSIDNGRLENLLMNKIQSPNFVLSDSLALLSAIGGTQGTQVFIKNFNASATINSPQTGGSGNYSATLRFEINDDFGVSRNDIYAPPLAAFWVLQHERMGPAPFVNKIVVEVPITGMFDVPPGFQDVVININSLNTQSDKLIGSANTETDIAIAAAEPTESTAPGFGSDPQVFYRYVTADGLELTGIIEPGKSLDNFVLPPNQFFTATFYQPSTNRSTQIASTSAPSGELTLFSSSPGGQGERGSIINLDTFGGLDTDGDGIPDVGEFAIGTNPNGIDSDDDGISDAAELEQGLDPLGGQAFPTGIIASLPLQGEANAVVVEGDNLEAGGQTAYVATGSHGLAIIDAGQFNNPIIQGQLDLPGDATDVAVDPTLQIAAVATNSGGLQIVDVSDPMVPTLLRTVNITANQVEVLDGVAYATVSGTLEVVDLSTGEPLQSLNLPGFGTVTGLAREGNTLYAFRSGSDTFMTIDIAEQGAASVLGQLNVSVASGDVGVFAANGTAYLAGSGLRTIDVSHTNIQKLISDANFFFTARNVALNGSGLALVAAENQGIGVYDITDPENTNNVLFTVDTPGFARDIAIASGIAFIADDTGGLQVINYRPFDNQGFAPTITISSPVVDVDPNTEGVQVTEGGDIPIIAAVTDDVQVRNVELLVNGEVVSNDVSFPFDLAAIALSKDPDATIVEVQARATDTGGNTAFSNVLTFDLVPDTFGPVIKSITPADGGNAPFNSRRVTVRFNEALAETTVTAENFQLLNSSGEVIIPENIQLRSGDRTVQLTYSALEVGDYSIVIKSAQITDRAGNVLGSENVVSSFTVNPQVEYNLSDLDGSNGFVLNGINSRDYSEESVSGAGDINGDGIDDLIISAYRADPNGNDRAGETYVVFGSNQGFAATLDLSNLNGSNGFVLNGIDIGDRSGFSVSGAGDINGDGIDDLIIGALDADPNGNDRAGETYVVFGSDEEFAASLDLSNLDGNNGFVLNGIDSGDISGRSVSGAGDINGDGIDDLIIGAPGADPNGNSSAGKTYVVFGSDEGFAASLDLSTLDGSNGIILNGIDSYDYSGTSVSGAGDINGDGIDDLIIGAFTADPNGNSSAGKTYVVFGSDEGFAASFNLSTLNGSNGFVLNGIDSRDYSGFSVSGAGDINGDGIHDLIIGALGADPNGNDRAGETYVVFGSDEEFDASLDLSTLNGSNGFVLNGIDFRDHSGRSVSGAGDINGDGIDDLIIGAYGADPNGNISAGETYVIFGSNEGFDPSFNLSDLNGNNGFVLNGIDMSDLSGFSVSGAGDINGDGIDDLIIGAPDADPNGNSGAGETYVVFGSRAFG